MHPLKLMPFSSRWWPPLYSACVGDTELSVSRSAVTRAWKERFVTLGNSITWCQNLEAHWHYVANWWGEAMPWEENGCFHDHKGKVFILPILWEHRQHLSRYGSNAASIFWPKHLVHRNNFTKISHTHSPVYPSQVAASTPLPVFYLALQNLAEEEKCLKQMK